ncbi:MAG: TRAP transporter small permease [Kiritimatiellae bacterium]|nr:TRAP transporter small permease [Kiritimatiellia bacterium]
MAEAHTQTAVPRLWLPVKALVLASSALAGVGVLAMTAVTCLDIAMRQFGRPLTGAYDMVRIAGGVTLACALPLTTAVKGHVAIEYFFHKLGHSGRIVVDTLMRLLQIGAFAIAAWQCARYGRKLLLSGEVTPTLQWPTFWVAWVLATACALTSLVTLFHLVHPGREMIRS